MDKNKFWKPDEDGGVDKRLEEERGTNEEKFFVFNSNHHRSMVEQRKRLPIYKHRSNLIHLVNTHQVVVIVGETGSGKSTQVPQYLWEAGWAGVGECIVVTQPRRVAATTLASRVADEKNVKLGEEVGHSVRFDNCSSDRTKVKFVTDGVLIRQVMQDPLLTAYSVVIVDEAHERSINTDLLLGLLKKILKRRPTLRVIVSSATIDAHSITAFFNTNPTSIPSQDTVAVLAVEGRTYPVEILYKLDPVPDYVKACVDTVVDIHTAEKEGDVLVFLPGQEEVNTVVSELKTRSESLENKDLSLSVVPLYSGLPFRLQMKAFERSRGHIRKVVVATNIAETSLTINGVVYVVDTGFVRMNAFNPRCGLNTLITVPTSQAEATQRAGRAGRVRAGKVYRLYTEEQFVKLAPSTTPEMERGNIAGVLLQLKSLGVNNVIRFPFISPPSVQTTLCALDQLYALGALDEQCCLTDPVGKQMAELPLPPPLARMVVLAGELGCGEEVLVVCAMLQIRSVFVNAMKRKGEAEKARRKFSVEEGDLVTLVNVYKAFVASKQSKKFCEQHYLNYKGLSRAVELTERLSSYLRRFDIPLLSCQHNTEALVRCIAGGFFCNAAHYHHSGEYRTIRDQQPLQIHPSSTLYPLSPPPYVVFNEVVYGRGGVAMMVDVTVLSKEVLLQTAPHYFTYQASVKRARLL